MIGSVNSNSELIASMIKSTKNNDKIIGSKLKQYATNKKKLSQSDISLYVSYLSEKEELEKKLSSIRAELNSSEYDLKRIACEEYRSDTDHEKLHSFFSAINTLQINVIQMLCSLLGSSGKLLCRFA